MNDVSSVGKQCNISDANDANDAFNDLLVKAYGLQGNY